MPRGPRIYDARWGLSRQLRPACREGSPAVEAGFVHLRPLPHPESHARPGARPHSYESRRLRPQWMAHRPNPAAIYRGSPEDIRRAGNRTGSAREATSRRKSCHRLSFGKPPSRSWDRGLIVEWKGAAMAAKKMIPPRAVENAFGDDYDEFK